MNNNVLYLAQTREGIKDNISKNPTQIIIYRNILIDNGLGDMVPDPHNVNPEPVTLTCRISKEPRRIEKVSTGPLGLSYEYVDYIFVDHETIINEHESFEANGTRWRIGPVETMMKFGGITGRRAPLIEAAEAPESST